MRGWGSVTLANPPHILLCFGRSCSEICHISNKPEVLCFPWKSPQTPQCHWSLAGQGRQASPHHPGFHNRGRESCWQRSLRGHESKKGNYGDGGVKGAFLAILLADPNRRLLCWDWGRKTLGSWRVVDRKCWRSTEFFKKKTMEADFEGFLQEDFSLASIKLEWGNNCVFGSLNLDSRSFPNEDKAGKMKLVYWPPCQSA